MTTKLRRRYLRTLFLGVAMLGVLLWAAIDQFGVAPGELLELFQILLLGVLLLILLAAILAAIWVLARRLLGNRR